MIANRLPNHQSLSVQELEYLQVSPSVSLLASKCALAHWRLEVSFCAEMDLFHDGRNAAFQCRFLGRGTVEVSASSAAIVGNI